jgi:ubiquinol-cytochrome c reductase cytochrome c1 subunit
VANFLMWTAEPNLEKRHSMGVTVVLFLLVFTGFLYAAKRKVWSDQH